MNSKKVNRIFLAVILTHIATVTGLTVFHLVSELPIVPNFIVSQLIILVPALTGVFLSKENLVRLAGFHRIRISSALMTVLFTFLTMPLVVVINAFSMLFVENTVVAMSGEILQTPFFVMLFIIGIFGPFSEELVFRGIVYQGYRKSGTALQALLLSALLFALMHMNFNQAAYAVVLGVILALLAEATGSLWGSIIFHVVFNSEQVCMMYLSGRMDSNALIAAEESMTSDVLIMGISVWLVIAAVTTAIAGCVLVWIAKNEKREENLRAVWSGRKNKTGNPMITVPLLVAIVICLFYMCFDLIYR